MVQPIQITRSRRGAECRLGLPLMEACSAFVIVAARNFDASRCNGAALRVWKQTETSQSSQRLVCCCLMSSMDAGGSASVMLPDASTGRSLCMRACRGAGAGRLQVRLNRMRPSGGACTSVWRQSLTIGEVTAFFPMHMHMDIRTLLP